jgi:phosphatidyl-myo-inositol dimannoside synthase
MEILVVTWNYPPRRGGMEQLLASLCDGLSKHHRVRVITTHAGRLPAGERGNVYRADSPGLITFFLFALRQGSALLRENSNIRIVFGGSVLMTPIALILARWFGRKSVIQAHGLDLIYRHTLYQLLVVNCLRYVDRVIANSNHTASLARRKGVTGNRLSVIPPGVDWQRLQFDGDAESLKKARGLDGKKIILFVGRLAPRKGVKEFIEGSLLHIVKQLPEACFVIVGENPTESLTHRDDVVGAVRQVIDKLKLSDFVHWLGGVSDDELTKVYAMSDVLVLPVLSMDSDVEGFGMVSLEAAAAGKPVVATMAGGVPDGVVGGESGILVQVGDYQGMTTAIVTLLKDSRMASKLGEGGRQRAANHFDWTIIVGRYQAVFNQLCPAPA